MTSTSLTTTRELDARTIDGLDVRLLWNSADDSLTVTVADSRTEEFFVLPVSAVSALEAFHHPFAYAAAPARATAPVGC